MDRGINRTPANDWGHVRPPSPHSGKSITRRESPVPRSLRVKRRAVDRRSSVEQQGGEIRNFSATKPRERNPARPQVARATSPMSTSRYRGRRRLRVRGHARSAGHRWVQFHVVCERIAESRQAPPSFAFTVLAGSRRHPPNRASHRGQCERRPPRCRRSAQRRAPVPCQRLPAASCAPRSRPAGAGHQLASSQGLNASSGGREGFHRLPARARRPAMGSPLA